MVNSKISIITVSFNAVNTIEKTILSVLNQTYTNIEYIVIDGGSTDGTLDVIRKYSNDIDHWITEPDQGVFDAMNKGVSIATGTWINFMNSGDHFYSLDTISKMIKLFIENNDVIYGGVDLVDICFSKIVMPNKSVSRSNPMPFNHQSVFVKRDLLVSYPFELNYKYAADYNFFHTIYPFASYAKFAGVVASYTLDGISSINGLKVNLERIKSNPCFLNYYVHLLYVRNYMIKKLLSFFKLNKLLILLRRWVY